MISMDFVVNRFSYSFLRGDILFERIHSKIIIDL